MDLTSKILKIYKVKHSSIRNDVDILILAENIEEAIDKFNKYYDYDIKEGEIENVELFFNKEVILEK